METIILASGSPRRHELLTRVKISHKVISPDIPEVFDPAAPVPDIVTGLACRKVEAVLEMFKPESPRWILGVDTVVEVEGRVLGKPGDPQEAESMLASLSGRVHRVWSGLVVHVDRVKPLEREAVCTEVAFRQMSPEEIRFYLDTGEWAGVAGAYRIQERGAFFVEWIRGSYSNVVGLPLEAFYAILKRNAFHF